MYPRRLARRRPPPVPSPAIGEVMRTGEDFANLPLGGWGGEMAAPAEPQPQLPPEPAWPPPPPWSENAPDEAEPEPEQPEPAEPETEQPETEQPEPEPMTLQVEPLRSPRIPAPPWAEHDEREEDER